MGYCIELIEKNFKIKPNCEVELINKIKEFCKNFKGYNGDGKITWVDKNSVLESNSLEEIFDEFRYPLTKLDDGSYDIDYFSGEKLGDDYSFFFTIAPFVEDGSYIEMLGEDGDKWRWIFKDGKCNEKYPKVEW